MIRVCQGHVGRVAQGDIYRNVPMLEYVAQADSDVEMSVLYFPLVIVLTQDCDLAQDQRRRSLPEGSGDNHDKMLLSVLVAPLYNAEQVFQGTHMESFGLKMAGIPDKYTKGKIRANQLPRYHYVEFPRSVGMIPSIIDFKHYFPTNLGLLVKTRADYHVCQVSELFREDMPHRFASFLSRIGLPPDDATAPPAEPESGSGAVSPVGEHPASSTK